MRRVVPIISLLLVFAAEGLARAELLVAKTAPSAARESDWAVELYGRYVRAPDFLVAGLFSVRTTMDSYTVGAAARWRWREGSEDEWRFFIDYTRLGFRDGNWLEKSLPPPSAVHLAWDLGYLSAGAAYVWRFMLVPGRLRAELGVGAALGFFLGEVQATDVVPTCQSPAASCPHWRWASRRAIELPTRVLALPIAHAGLEWSFWSPLSLRLEAGLYGLPFVGLALASRL